MIKHNHPPLWGKAPFGLISGIVTRMFDKLDPGKHSENKGGGADSHSSMYLFIYLSLDTIQRFVAVGDSGRIEGWRVVYSSDRSDIERLARGFVRALRPKVLIFYCLATNDNKDPPCLRVMVHIHLNWCLEGCTEWRWMWSHLVQVLDRRIEKERQAMFWHTWLETHLSEFSISEEKAACHPPCTSEKAQGWVWSLSVYVGCKSHLSRKKISAKRFFCCCLIRWFSERILNNKFRHPRVCFPIMFYKSESLG